MTLLILIGLSLSLAGVAGLQFFYLIYLERINNAQKNASMNSKDIPDKCQNA